MANKFGIRRSTNNQFYWNLNAANGEPIAHSETYVSKQGAINGIDSVKRNAVLGQYTLFIGGDSKYYWNLKAPNNEIIARSEGYTTKQGAENGIASTKRNAPTAPVVDES
ncbi:UNVERIFIED_CONTAM: hypothetical protein GTU68_009748 [Idotea baltica]|nr:hypothetical protein [Idotea baltica]